MAKRREVPGLNIALLDILTGALGAVIILYVAVPKGSTLKKEVEAKASIAALENKVKSLSEKLSDKKMENLQLQQDIKEKERVVASVTEKLKTNELEKKSLEQKMVELEKKQPTEPNASADKWRGQGLPVDVGFEFKGKKIVFLIDVSGSMNREDRLGQVKAGLKMLITSMPRDYELDVIFFPGRNKSPFQSLWGSLKNLESYEKKEIYSFLLKLRARGYTPTRDAVEHALANYEGASDIVLLSDGAPTLGTTNKEEDISNLLIAIKQMNKSKVRINTIGVGSSFVKKKGSKAYVFLQELAKDHGGFFFGF